MAGARLVGVHQKKEGTIFPCARMLVKSVAHDTKYMDNLQRPRKLIKYLQKNLTFSTFASLL